MSYTEEEEGYIREFLENHDFDFVIGSLHYVKGCEISNVQLANESFREKLKDTDPWDIYSEYFRILKKAIETRLFDVVAHPDIYKRTLPEPSFLVLLRY